MEDLTESFTGEEISKQVFLVLDNARPHKTKTVKKFLMTTGVKTLFLSPRSPALNAAEKCINVIKSKIRKIIKENR